ncbi:serine/threonine protein kinase [bacterium]|nr:serine/threonine protein kinase [bacterium]
MQLLHGRYEIGKVLKQGGMGAVYTATDTKLANSPCALKEILDDKHTDEYYQARFSQEMAALARLDHPRIPKVRDFFRLRGKSYMVMDLVQGTSLEDEIEEQGKNPPQKVVRDMLQVLDVLEYLHGHDPALLHRDIKPANLLRERRDGQIKVVDFGLARSATGQHNLQTAVGTMGYCAPEQMRGHAEPRSDIFSVGATMLHLLTGRPCCLVTLAACDDEGLPELPEGLSPIVARAIQFRANRRFASAREMAVALDRWLVEFGHRHQMSSARLSFGGKRGAQPEPTSASRVWFFSVAVSATVALWAGVTLGKKTQPTIEPSRPPGRASLVAMQMFKRMMPGPQKLVPGKSKRTTTRR